MKNAPIETAHADVAVPATCEAPKGKDVLILNFPGDLEYFCARYGLDYDWCRKIATGPSRSK